MNVVYHSQIRIGIHLVIDCSTKSGVWHACVIMSLCAYVITSLMCLCASVLTCLHALCSYVLTCSHALCSYVLTCSRAKLLAYLACSCALHVYAFICFSCFLFLDIIPDYILASFFRLPYLLYISKVKFRKKKLKFKILPRKICLYFLFSVWNQVKRSSEVNNKKICKIMIKR